MAELLTRETGCCKGRGGSMHVCDVANGLMGTNAIVAGHIPIAGGVALAAKMRDSGQVTVCFFGDGATCEASFPKHSTWRCCGTCRWCLCVRTTAGRFPYR